MAALAALTFPASASGADKGIETEITWSVPPAVQQADADALTDLGVSWSRLMLNWHDAEPGRGTLDAGYLASVDQAVALTRERGVRIVMDVGNSPSWASGTGNPEAPPTDPQDYARFVAAMTERYRGEVAAWEVWNEPNTARFWNGSPDAGQYAQMLRATYPAVKSADPDALVLFGGLSTNDWPFLERAYAAVPHLGRYFEAMAAHPYSGSAPPDAVSYVDGRESPGSFTGWLTEFGWSTTSQPWGVSEQQQADYTRLAFACVAQDAYVQVAIVYELRNNYWTADADTWEDQLGLVRTDWTAKTAYAALRAVDPESRAGCQLSASSDTGQSQPFTFTYQPHARQLASASRTRAHRARRSHHKHRKRAHSKGGGGR